MYLQKRHPLYFLAEKINETQMVDLLKRLIYRLKMRDEMAQSNKTHETSESKQSDIIPVQNIVPFKPQDQNLKVAEPVMFKSGGKLPAVDDFEEAAKEKANKMFDEDDAYYDDFEESGANQGQDPEFNANELLNFKDYQNKRQSPTEQVEPAKPKPNLNIKEVLNGGAAKLNNQAFDEDFEIEDDWGDEWGEDSDEKAKDFSQFDYNNKDLNQMGDKELAQHKKAMDKDFGKNQLKPGDEGFEYDKKIEFTKAVAVEDNSWDDSEEAEMDDDFKDPLDESY